jgi:hypothetical protein
MADWSCRRALRLQHCHGIIGLIRYYSSCAYWYRRHPLPVHLLLVLQHGLGYPGESL